MARDPVSTASQITYGSRLTLDRRTVMRAIPRLLCVAVLLMLCLDPTASAGSRSPAVTPAVPEPAGILLRFRGGGSAAVTTSKVSADKVSALSGRSGVPLGPSRRIGPELQAVRLGVPATNDNVAATLEIIRRDPDVEFAEPDLRRFPHATPNDALFPGQWYLQNSPTTPSAVDAVSAWEVTTGSSGVIVAVLDTGVRYDHPDLLPATAGGRLLPGHDFVRDPSKANDGDGWDADPSDPGDWVSAAEAASGPFNGCAPDDSSWHGTRVAGIVGAVSNNARGIAGTTWNGWVLPVRALGKCGGTDSDIIAAMLWAGGVPVDGAPANPYPARVINMSLGGRGACLQTYRSAISQLAARGTLVVASVGNEGSVVVAPANCPGVVGVAGIRHVGTKVGFSNLGPGVALSAPGGNCVNVGAGEPCLFSIDTATNLGLTTPGANAYTDQLNYNVGTSFAAPIVSGIAGLMAAVNGRLTPVQLLARLQEGATRPFPLSTDPSVPVCRVPASSSDIQASECVCTTQTCGAGMANAAASVRAALRPVAAVAVPANVSPGQNVQLRAGGSGAACNRSVARYSWAVIESSGPPPGLVGAETETVTAVAPASGSFTVRLTVTDDAGSTDSADVVIGPNAATTSAPSVAGGPACPTPVAIALPVSVAVSPASVTLVAGVGTQAFTASVANASDTRVTWYVNDIDGGNSTVGTISTAGLYTAPARRPDPATVTVKAIAVADASKAGTANVTIAPPAPINSGGGGGGGGSVGLGFFLLLATALARRTAS